MASGVHPLWRGKSYLLLQKHAPLEAEVLGFAGLWVGQQDLDWVAAGSWEVSRADWVMVLMSS